MKLSVVENSGLNDKQRRELEVALGSMQHVTAQATDDALSAEALCGQVNSLERWLSQFN